MPYVETPEGDLILYRPDGRRVTIPESAIAMRHRDDRVAVELPIPTARSWRVESLYLRQGLSMHLHQLSQLESWSREKHGHITDATIRGRMVVIAKPKPLGGTLEVPYASLGWIIESPIAEAVVEREITCDEIVPVRPLVRSTKERR